MIRVVAAAVLASAMIACGSTLREIDGQAGGTRLSDSEGRALHAAAITPSPAPTPGRPVGTPALDWRRITDEHGGWSIDVPRSWFDHARSPTGSSWRGSSSYDPSTSTIPLPTGASIGIQLLWDWDGDATTDLRTFAERRVWIATCVACRKILETRRTTLAGQDAEFYTVSQNQPQPFDQLEPHLFWLLRSPYFADRVLVITAVPAASPFRATVERIVSTLQLFRPTPPDLTPTKTRQQVIDEFRRGVNPMPGSFGTGTRVEAKLMRWQDWEIAYNAALRASSAAGGGPSGAHGAIDPDVVVWVVAMTGTFEQLARGPAPPLRSPGASPAPARTPIVQHWRISAVPAREPYGWGGPSFGGPEPTWPAWYDQLTDLAP
jgi:hypothetical protein